LYTLQIKENIWRLPFGALWALTRVRWLGALA